MGAKRDKSSSNSILQPICVCMYVISVFQFRRVHVKEVVKTMMRTSIRKGPNCTNMAEVDKKRARKNMRKHKLTIFHLDMLYALMGIRLSALQT
jgi:hypothetical protein